MACRYQALTIRRENRRVLGKGERGRGRPRGAVTRHVLAGPGHSRKHRPADQAVAGGAADEIRPRRNRQGRPVVLACMAAGHTITIIPADRHIEVRVDGQKLAESDRAMRLDETGLPARYYLPREDVRTDLLRPTNRKTTCPFKGQASYWSAQVGDELHENLVWSYETPIPAARQIAGLMCFYNERVDLTISDQHQQDPNTSSRR